MPVRKIIHVDMDAFYASVEQRDDPQLRGKPVIVAWQGSRSVVCAASYEARAFGVRSAMPAVRAERLCPAAIFVPPDFVRYRAVSHSVREIFKRHTDLIEPLSLDEAYLDVTENKTSLPTATLVARTIREQIRQELNLTASAGVATNKFLAKLASDWRKPDALFVIQPDDVDAFLLPLAVTRLPGVGKVTGEKLAKRGIQTVRDLRGIELTALEADFGSYGTRLYELSRDVDRSEVFPDRPTKSILAATVAGLAMAGTLSVQIKEYEVPTPRSRPHDPALAPDGSLWYTGQGANKLGRLDPKTGEFKEFPLKTPNSGPHGLVADKEGNIWFTAISGGYIGKLDPKTGAITEYHAPHGTEIDPHTPVFDHNGILWFTNEETNYIGRLDPSIGKMTLAKSPTPHAVPYGIVVTKDNVPFFCEFGTNKLASIDPNSMKIREYTLPAANARPRRIALAPDGTIYYTDYARGYLGHFDPASGKLLKEWTSPGGTGSEPYGIAVTKDGEVWYSESGVKPNTLVKFDPKSESFSTEPIPSGGGVVRNMVATPDRRLYLACSGVNKVAVVDLNR